jgi:hypothetical protein
MSKKEKALLDLDVAENVDNLTKKEFTHPGKKTVLLSMALSSFKAFSLLLSFFLNEPLLC